MAVGHSWLRQTFTERCRYTCIHTAASHLVFNSRLHDVTEWYRRVMSQDQYSPWHWRCGWCRPAVFINTRPSWWAGLGGMALGSGTGKALVSIPSAGLSVYRGRLEPCRDGEAAQDGKNTHPSFSDQSFVLQHLHLRAGYPLQALLLPSHGRDSTEHP